MAEFDIDKIVADAVAQIHTFAKEHSNETFYAFAIDAGMLCFNSEERFEETLIKYRTRWKANHERVLSRENMTEQELRMIKDEYAIMEDMGLKMSSANNLEEFIDFKIESNNSRNRKYLEEGNPYEKEDEVEELKYNTGDWKYQGFGDLHYPDSEDVYDEHYDMAESKQHTSEYSQLVNKVLEAIEQDRDKIFASLKLTADFRFMNAEHKY